MAAPRQIARLKVTLADIEPVVVRRLEVPLKIRLDRLHLVLQAAMPWTDSHLYEFMAGGMGWGVPDQEGFHDGPLPASKATLQKVIEETGAKTIRYIYDWGDHWDHEIRIERIEDAQAGRLYPALIMAAGRCPPEDVGSSSGYGEFLEAIADSNHPEHAAMLRWHGGPFDPDDPDIEVITAGLDRLARRWAPRPRKAKP